MYISVFVPVPYCLVDCGFVVEPEFRQVDSSSSILLESYWSFSFSIIPSKEIPGLISFRMDWLDLLAQSKGLSRVFSNTTVQKHQFFGTQLPLWSNLSRFS